jgi:hypothetical protein
MGICLHSFSVVEDEIIWPEDFEDKATFSSFDVFFNLVAVVVAIDNVLSFCELILLDFLWLMLDVDEDVTPADFIVEDVALEVQTYHQR